MHQITIIIPAYNCEKQISRCLDSVIDQTYSNFECIIIDDGSVDATGSICKEYASNDNRFIYIKQNNAGASAARNVGLDLCRSNFVCFIDADDYVSPSYLMDLMNDAGSNDLVIHGMTRVCSDRIIDRGMHITGEFCLDKNPSLFFQSVNIERFGGPVCKLFSYNIIYNQGLRFNNKIKLAEDLDFLLRYLLHCSRIKVSAKNNYFYIETPNSATSKIYNFEDEYHGLYELSKSWNLLTEKYIIDSLQMLSLKSKAYLTHRAIISIYKKESKYNTRLSRLKDVSNISAGAYTYFTPTTPFLKSLKFLFVNDYLFLLNLALSIRFIKKWFHFPKYLSSFRCIM